jgi:hypothetical protein
MMTHFLKKLLHAGVHIEDATRRTWERMSRPFLSKAEAARRASWKCETLKRQEMEAERLDRLRNPRNYEGKL